MASWAMYRKLTRLTPGTKSDKAGGRTDVSSRAATLAAAETQAHERIHHGDVPPHLSLTASLSPAAQRRLRSRLPPQTPHLFLHRGRPRSGHGPPSNR